MTTVDALWFVHAKAEATFRTLPLGIFLGNKALYASTLNALKIRNDAYPISHSVPVIEMKQIGAGELGTRKAEPMTTSGKLSTVLDDTGETGIRFVAVASPATGTWVSLSNKCAAHAAVQATRRYKVGTIQKP